MRVPRLPAKGLSAFALIVSLAPGAAPPSYRPPAGAAGASALFPSTYSPATTAPPRPAPAPRPAAEPVPAPAPAPAPVPVPTATPPRPGPPSTDAPVRRVAVQQPPAPVETPALPDAALPAAGAAPAVAPGPLEGGQSLSLQAALMGAIRYNPDLITLRNSNVASPEAVEVARRFPTALNPTVWIDYRPITLIPRDTFANNGTGAGGTGTGTGGTPGRPTGPFYHFGQNYFLFSVRQPVELGHQTTHRYEIARAALNQQQWTVVQAELLAMVQTYRFFQTAAYRRERFRVARNLADFNDRLVQTLRRRLEANQSAAADVVLAEVENEATRQLVEVARQDYAIALADLRNQVGMPETAGTAEPLGEFVLPGNIPPVDENALVQMALASRPEIHAAKATARGAYAAVRLARGDRIPTPVIGPQYAIDEAGIQYIGLVLVSTIPVLNNGTPLVLQREADYRRALSNVEQVEKRTAVQVRAAAAKWNAANRLVNQTAGMAGSLRGQVERMEQLFEANQADLTRLFQTRQRLIQLENASLDALWQATQAHADLLTALGAPNLIAALHATGPAPAPAQAATAPAPPPAVAPAPAAPAESR